MCALPAAAAPTFGTATNTSLRRCNVTLSSNCPGAVTLKAVRQGGPGRNRISSTLIADAGTAQEGSYATGAAELRGLGLPVIRASAYAAGTDSRLVGSAQAWQTITWGGTAATDFGLAGNLHFADSSVSPVNGLAAGGASYTAYIYIWDAAQFPIDPDDPPFFDLVGFDTDPCRLSGMLGAATSAGTTPGGEFEIGIATSACGDGQLQLNPGQSIVVQTNFNLFANRGGFIDATQTFTTALDPALGQATLNGLSQGLAFAGSAVPESASWAMLIAGFGLTGAATRRRRHQIA
ncbi:PEPxxWA-CTERM sorting domain-containing protein [Sandarakinorhabdus sp. DWP1-3-1]|uniref:PEPxxWA-CTERM sorting domain-containing protein n=1 Tax=Sandarakinorhabdus sp. DWP1-3-1 TaxID=2804627 RepID=UPI003CE7F98C